MEKKNFKKYFTQNSVLLILGIAVAVAGALLYGINYFFVHEWVLWQSSVLILVAGVVIAICHFSMRVRDGAVDEYAQSFHRVAEEELEAFVNETEKRPVKVFNFTTGCYASDDPDVKNMVVGGDSTPRCEKYSSTAMVYTTHNLFTVNARIDLITGDVTAEKAVIPLSEIVNVKACDNSYTKEIKGKNRYVECFKLLVETKDNTLVFNVRNDALTDEAVAKISRTAESKRQES